mgnify:CR=1 FL=1|jgi:hypothetical protein
MNNIVLGFVPLYLLLELYADFRLPILAKKIEARWPEVHQRVGYSHHDGAYRHALKTNFVLPFLMRLGELPRYLRFELRVFAIFRILAVCFFLLCVGVLAKGA